VVVVEKEKEKEVVHNQMVQINRIRRINNQMMMMMNLIMNQEVELIFQLLELSLRNQNVKR